MTALHEQVVTERENESIRDYIGAISEQGVFRDRDVIDYGCGRAPYRGMVEVAGGRWHGYDRGDFPANMTGGADVGAFPIDRSWDVILCTQVIQFCQNPYALLAVFHSFLKSDGTLVLTGPTNWPIVNVGEDLFRWTAEGIAHDLTRVGFREVVASYRWPSWCADGYSLPYGWGAIARK